MLFSAGGMIKMEVNCLEHGYKSARERRIQTMSETNEETRWLGLALAIHAIFDEMILVPHHQISRAIIG